MFPDTQKYNSSLEDFNVARRRASLQEILARVTGKSSELLSYEDVAQKLNLNVRSERGVLDIPLKAIIGSVGRYTEFTRDFMPLSSKDQQRWARVKRIIDDPESVGLPPIEVYKVGEIYFVLDGNHRVSVARSEGFEYISAHVIEVKTDIPITADIQPDDLIIKAEYADFLAQTGFADLCPGVDLSLSVPGQYGNCLNTSRCIVIIWVSIYSAMCLSRKQSGIGTIWFIARSSNQFGSEVCCTGSPDGPRQTFTCGFLLTGPTWNLNLAGRSDRKLRLPHWRFTKVLPGTRALPETGEKRK
jgi:hypothetical protein